MDPSRCQRDVVDVLRTVIDPCCRERGISVVDMGLVDDVEVAQDGSVHVEVMLTSGWCPFQVDLVAEIESAVRSLPDVADATVSITLDRAWSTDRMSADAAAKLRFLPDPSEVGDPTEWSRRPLPLAPAGRGAEQEHLR